jgi:hypothetical protein
MLTHSLGSYCLLITLLITLLRGCCYHLNSVIAKVPTVLHIIPCVREPLCYTTNMMQQPLTALYKVFEITDLKRVRNVFQGFHRDMAETAMHTKFKAARDTKDFVLYNRKSKEIECGCFSTKTEAIRNKCWRRNPC